MIWQDHKSYQDDSYLPKDGIITKWSAQVVKATQLKIIFTIRNVRFLFSIKSDAAKNIFVHISNHGNVNMDWRVFVDVVKKYVDVVVKGLEKKH